MYEVYESEGDWFFTVFPVLFFIVFAIILMVFIGVAFKGLREWNHNNQSPNLRVLATLTSKRTDVSRHTSHHHDHPTSHSSTTYYATFEFDSGERMEFTVPNKTYGLLTEGDVGELNFQGSRFLAFERYRKENG
ncbi:DUF2500 domain-containing protein [Shouchella sp. JSM 1781072]|uniref:DUF2500 domain-containing protein n=1 Tax=Shouchella sp. JSM 1781072 TaxID=3344581 RepID=UPI0035BFDDFF